MSDPLQQFPSLQTPTSQTYLDQPWRPGVIGRPEDHELDLAVKTAYDRLDSLRDTTTQVPDALKGSRTSSGALTVTGAVKGVATGLGTVSNVVASVDNGASPHSYTVSATPSSISMGAFDLYVWKPTSSANMTPIAATAPVLVRWIAWGT